MFRNQTLRETFETSPMVAYRQPNNLRKVLCKAKLYKNSHLKTKKKTRTDAPGWSNCQKNCKICPYTLPKCSLLQGLASKQTHTINQNVNCNTENCIYCWRCTKDNCKDHPENEYFGKTKRKFKDRFSEHRDYVKSENLIQPAGENFNSKGHSVAHLKGMVVEKVTSRDPFVLEAREKLFIQRFDTFHRGLYKKA